MTISRRKLLQSGAVAGAAGFLPIFPDASDAQAAQRGAQQSGGSAARCILIR